MISDDIRSMLVHERKSPDDDMGRDPCVKKREYIWNEDVVLSGGDNLPKTQMKIVIISLRFLLIFFGSLYSGERLCSFCSSCFGLLFCSSICSSFITVEIIDTVESHRRVISS